MLGVAELLGSGERKVLNVSSASAENLTNRMSALEPELVKESMYDQIKFLIPLTMFELSSGRVWQCSLALWRQIV